MVIFNYITKVLYFFVNRSYRRKQLEIYQLKKLKRFTPTEVTFLNSPINIIDSTSFLFQYNEIFIRKIYKFNSRKDNPTIIDGGSNIGLAIIYWKSIYPNANIIGFEPDLKVFSTLAFNIKSFRYKNVSLINKGLWKNDGEKLFSSDGSDGGRITDNPMNATVEVTSLRKYLSGTIDFLKLDIEGAEIEVLIDCEEYLNNVENLFIEYHSFENQVQKLDILLSIISKAGFRYYIQSIGVNSPHPFVLINKYQEMDLQLNIYAYRP